MNNFVFPSLEEFRSWLESKGEKYIGKTRTTCNCPYYNFLLERGLIQGPNPRKAYTPALWADMLVLGNLPGDFAYTPANIERFVRKLDWYFIDCTEVTGKFCLDLLDSLEEK